MSVEDRLKQLQEAHRDFGPASQHFLSSKFFELIDACEIWQLSQTVTALHSRFPYGLRNRKFPFHVVNYLPVFAGLFHLLNSTDILTGMFPLGITAISCRVMVVPSLTCGCSRICVCSYPHPLIPCYLFPQFPFASTLAGMTQRKSCLDFFFFFLIKGFMSYIPATSNKGVGKANLHHFLLRSILASSSI